MRLCSQKGKGIGRYMKIQKRLLSILMAAVMAVGMTACGSPAEAVKDKDGSSDAGSEENVADVEEKTEITLTYWNKEETMRPLLKLLKEKLPDIEVTYAYTSNAVYGTTVRTKLLSGAGDDILVFDAQDTQQLGSQGLLEDLSELYAEDYASAPGFTVDGKMYGLPLNTWYEGIYYNKDIFEQNGIQLPATFDELLAVCEKLQNAGIQPLTIGAKSADTLIKSSLGYITAEYLLQDDGKDFDSKFSRGEIKMADAWTPYLEEWSRLVKDGYINDNMLGVDPNQAMDEFVTGVAAMWPSGTWDYNTIKKKNINMNFGLMPYPGSRPENACLVGGASGAFCINSKSKNVEAAYRVLEVIASAEGQKALCEGSPGSGSYLEGVAVEIPEEYEPVRDTLEAGRVYCSWDNWGDLDVFPAYGQAVQSVVIGSTPKAALEEVDEQADRILRGRR